MIVFQRCCQMRRSTLQGMFKRDVKNNSNTQIGYKWFATLGLLLVSGVLLASCSGWFGGTPPPASNASPANVALAKLRWCGKALMLFRDEGATPTVTPATATPQATATVSPSPTTTPGAKAGGTTPVATGTPVAPTPTTITDWTQVKANLGFSVFLPTTLPDGSCLVSASGTLHDAIFGSNFTISYLLPDHSALTLSEAPTRVQNMDFQCNPNSTTTDTKSQAATSTPTHGATKSTQAQVQLCSGTRDSTNIVFSARGATKSLQQFFQTLKSDVDWVPVA